MTVLKNLPYCFLFVFVVGCADKNDLQSTKPAEVVSQQPKIETQGERVPEVEIEPFILENGVALKEILTSSALTMNVGEELFLVGEVALSNGQRVSFDRIKNLLEIENQNPELLALDFDVRLVKAVKAGTARIKVQMKNVPHLNAFVTVKIQQPSLDPTVAILNLEIE